MTEDSVKEETDGHIAVQWPTHVLDTGCTGEVLRRQVERCDDGGTLRHTRCQSEEGWLQERKEGEGGSAAGVGRQVRMGSNRVRRC